MRFTKSVIIAGLGLLSVTACANEVMNNKQNVQQSQHTDKQPALAKTPIVGAAQLDAYLPLLEGKRVALLVNQTSMIGATHLVDTLLSRNVKVTKIFSPEHGFRGEADAGSKVKDGIDPQTKLPVVSLYGKNKKPTAAQLADIDVVVYDLQDVGVRFYTYISSLEYMMEACAENNKTLIVLDRPDPLGAIVDGPVLQPKFKSFVGMQSIPVVYGMTVGEYAKMLVGEQWVVAKQLKMEIVPVKDWTRNQLYALPVAPSPNLKNTTAILLYPSLCFFEGTVISLGRGTDFPFQMFGHPKLKAAYPTYSFTPKSMPGATQPPLMNELCYGEMVANDVDVAFSLVGDKLELKWLLDAYKAFPDKANFFNKNNFFDLLAGTDQLRQQIIAGKSEADIRKSWQTDLYQFKMIRAKYLIYPEN